MLERSEASKISKPVISTTARRRRVVEGFARKNLKNREIVIPPTRMSVGCDEGTFRFP